MKLQKVTSHMGVF